MILERLSVEGFRHLATPYEFVPDERLTIVSAPNGTGKSTLLDALYSGLLEKHTVSGVVAAERFASRGRNLVPRIVVDFRIGDKRYRLRKHFLSDRLSKLERWEAARYVPFKEGAASDDFVRELFAAEAPGRGAVDATKHWGLAHILWSPSGIRYAALPATAGEHIRAMLSDVAAATLGERAIETRITNRFERYFTDSGAPARSASSANMPARDAEIGAAQIAVMEAGAAVRRLDDLRRSHEDSSWEAQRLAAMRADIRARLDDTKALAVSFDALSAQRQVCAGAQERWLEQSVGIKRRIEGIADFRSKRDAIRTKRTELQAQIDALAERLAASTLTLNAATRKADDASRLCLNVQAQAANVTAAATYIADLSEVARLQLRIGQIQSDVRAIEELGERRAQLLAPVKDELKRLRAADVERRSLAAKVMASALALEITSDADELVDVLIGDRPGAVQLVAGNAEIITGPDQIVLVVPGFGRIKARGADSAAAARRKLEPLVTSIQSALERFGAASIDELEARTERAAELDAQIALRKGAVAGRMQGDDPAADGQRLLEARTRLHVAAATHPAWQNDPPDAIALRTAFDRDLQQSADTANAAKVGLQTAQQRDAAIRSELDALTNVDRSLDAEEQLLAIRLADLTADGCYDAERDAALMHASLEWNAARGQREQLDGQLQAFGDNPHDTRKVLEAQEFATGQQYEERHGRAQADLALLEEFSLRGSYRRLAEAEEKLEALAGRQRIERADADAIRLLSQVFADVRNERIEAVLAPVEAGASRYLTRIAGTSLGPIQVAADLTPLGVRHRSTGELVSIESTLSAGEREQIYVAMRFALADVIAGTRGRQLFVLDDVLTATDPGRLRRFVTLLEELSRERLQIIVTTADASRYLGIAGAKHIDLHAALSIADAA